jgi:hypothetical protein
MKKTVYTNFEVFLSSQYFLIIQLHCSWQSQSIEWNIRHSNLFYTNVLIKRDSVYWNTSRITTGCEAPLWRNENVKFHRKLARIILYINAQ